MITGQFPLTCPKCGIKLEKVHIELKHITYCKGKYPHKRRLVPDGDYSSEYTDIEDCDGVLSYDEGAEGNFCSKCDYYDGPK